MHTSLKEQHLLICRKSSPVRQKSFIDVLAPVTDVIHLNVMQLCWGILWHLSGNSCWQIKIFLWYFYFEVLTFKAKWYCSVWADFYSSLENDKHSTSVISSGNPLPFQQLPRPLFWLELHKIQLINMIPGRICCLNRHSRSLRAYCAALQTILQLKL